MQRCAPSYASAGWVLSPSQSIDVHTETEQMGHHLHSPWSFPTLTRSRVQGITVCESCTVSYQEVEDCRRGIGGCNVKDGGAGFGAVSIRCCTMGQEPTDELLIADNVPASC